MDEKITVCRYTNDGENRFSVSVHKQGKSVSISNCWSEFEAANLSRELSRVIGYPIEYRIEVTVLKEVTEATFFTS